MKRYTFLLTHTAQRAYDKEIKRHPEKRARVIKAVRILETFGPDYPSLRTHVFRGHEIDGEPIFISYVENHTSSAWRIYWTWSTQTEATILGIYIGPHP